MKSSEIQELKEIVSRAKTSQVFTIDPNYTTQAQSRIINDFVTETKTKIKMKANVSVVLLTTQSK